MFRPAVRSLPLQLVCLCCALQASANQERRNFYMTIPSGIEIEAQQVGVGFYDRGDAAQTAPIYEIAAQFVVVDTGSGLRRSADHYDADTTDIDINDEAFAALVQDTRLVCLVTHEGVRRAIPRFVAALDAQAIDAITAHPASYYKVFIEFFPNRENATTEAYEPDRVEVVHDLRDGSCNPLSHDELPPVPVVTQ